MENMSKEEFFRQSEAAVRRMQEMSNRSNFSSDTHKMPPTPPFVKANDGNRINMQNAKEPQNNQPSQQGIALPFLDILKKDSDMTVILGLLLLLFSEKSDKWLMMALLYILM